MPEEIHNRALWPDEDRLKEEAKKHLDFYRWKVKTRRITRSEAVLAINKVNEPLKSEMKKQMKVKK